MCLRPAGAASQATTGMDMGGQQPEQQLTPPEKAYLEVVRQLNAAQGRREDFDAATNFSTACSSSAQGGHAALTHAQCTMHAQPPHCVRVVCKVLSCPLCY